ncbi:MAG: lipopolysaccharide kinase InaA family protein [Pseudomonadota bacterium]
MSELPHYSSDDLLRAGRELAPPFTLDVDFGEGERCFRVDALLRLLPQRRLAARAVALDVDADQPAAGPVLLKLFYGAGAVGYAAREHAGYERLAAARLPTPERLAHSDTACLYRWLEATPVDEDDPAAIDATIDAIGLLHAAALLQSDMHLANFLYDGERVWLVDPDGIRALSGEGRVAAPYRDNLAVFFAQLPPTADIHLPGRLMRYCHSAHIATDSEDALLLAQQLPLAVDRARAERVSRYLSKTMRDCTAFAAFEAPQRRFVALREALGPELTAFARDPEACLDHSVVLKAGNTATVMRVTIDGVSRIVKRYNIKSLSHRLRQSLRSSSRAERSWRNGHLLQFLRLPTATPIALLETRRAGLRDVAYLVTEDLGTVDLLAHFKDAPLTEALLDQITELFGALAAARLVHGDCKATNWLLHDAQLYLIDLDSLRSARSGYARDRARFCANWPAESEIGARLRARLKADA